MPKFLTIGYGDQAGYDRTSKPVRDRAHAHDEALRQMGAIMGIAGNPVQVRNPEAGEITVVNSAYLSSKLPIAGFMLLEAENLEHAIELVSIAPCAVAHGVVEVWPLEEAGVERRE